MTLRGTLALAGVLAGLPVRFGAAQTELQAPTPPASIRQPEPAAAALKEAEKKVRDLYKADYARRTPADLQTLAQRFLQEGLSTADEATVRYVYLREARDLAAQAADAALAMSAADQLGKLFAVDTAALKSAALAAVERAVRTPEAAATLVEVRLALAEEALAADQFDAATAHAAKAEPVARHTGDAALLARVQARIKEIGDVRAAVPAVRAAEKTLEEKPDDPAASLAAGRFWCLVKGIWEKGLPLLARGSDAAMKAAAARDLAKPATPADQVAAGDAWWDLAEKASGTPKARMTARAMGWYQQAWPTLSSLGKSKLRDRAKVALATRGVSLDPKAYKPPDMQPAGWEIDDRRAGHIDERFVRTGRFSLRFANPPADDAIRLTGGPIPASPGQKLTLSGWVLTEGTKLECDVLRIRFLDANGESVDSEGIYAPPDTPFWTPLHRTVPCPAGTVRVQVGFRMSSPGGQVWLDDVSLKRESDGIELVENGSFERKEGPKEKQAAGP
jgi:hypothetical protein